MKKVYLLFFSFLSIVLFSSGLIHQDRIEVQLNNYFNSDIPVLPEEPFDYDINVPAIMDPIFVSSTGWGNDTIDFALINENLDDDVSTLGRVLFYDTRLSALGEFSCGSCHIQAKSFADDVALSVGENGAVLNRNAPILNDLAWDISDFLFWDCRSNDLESLVLEPITAMDELNGDLNQILADLSNTSFYPELFNNAFGDEQISTGRIAIALKQFIESMSSFDSKFDKAASANNFLEFTDAEDNGRAIFIINCAQCHTAPHFGFSPPTETGDPLFELLGMSLNNGLDEECEDPGAGEFFDSPMFECFFRSPSLKNIEVSGPYMHDGRFETLDEVIDFYSDGVTPAENSFFSLFNGEDFTGFDFSDEEKANLKAFLLTLTDYTFLTHEKWSNPFPETSTALDQTLDFGKIAISPNPTDGSFSVEFNNPSLEKYNLSLSDLTGKQVYKQTITTDYLQVPDLGLPSGMYTVQISNQLRILTKKIIIQ